MSRILLTEPRRFLKNLWADYRKPSEITKKQKRKAYGRVVKLLLMYVWNGLSAPFIYPVWYLFRRQITNRIYQGTTWQDVVSLIDANKTGEVKQMLKKQGRFLYWLWTYADLRDPLGRGELPERVKKNSFWNRYWETGFRNCRFIINFMEFRSANIVRTLVIIDNRNFDVMIGSEGIGDSPSGIYFKWMLDEKGDWCFIYEDNNSSAVFYIGFVGLRREDIGHNGRFEVSYRP